MISGFFSAVSRLRWIQRWSLKRNTLTENVMEHSWEVAVIAHLLGCINNQRFQGRINPDRLSTLALYHDSAEAITGDLPTPVKYYSEEIQKAYKVIEQDAEQSLVSMLPVELRSVFKQVICGQGVSEEEAKFIKAADNLSAYVKALAELANGNREYEATVSNLKTRLHSYGLPEVDYFLSVFVAEEGDHQGQVKDAASEFEGRTIFSADSIRKLKLA
ncbi:5'-deoxynucleotidase [Halioxenophilus sp. WMMB6]|uniref:5'-deoxynucleotidase n=1 Tax=Halioxenophilus sp. WMMB6 TaxID=3073815 RepID=UPI00295F1D09|nr:5'-deoxynucleotidase [Halioxenophilus sp. WMMB6]